MLLFFHKTCSITVLPIYCILLKIFTKNTSYATIHYPLCGQIRNKLKQQNKPLICLTKLKFSSCFHFSLLKVHKYLLHFQKSYSFLPIIYLLFQILLSLQWRFLSSINALNRKFATDLSIIKK